MVSLAQPKQENILFQLYKHKAKGEHRKQHESDFVSPTYHHRKHPVLYSHPDTQIRVEMAFSLL